MHEKSVVDGSSGRGLRGSDRPFVRLWNRVVKQRRFGADTSPLWSPLVMCPLVLSCLVLSCAGLCRFRLLLSWLLLSSSSVVSSCRVPCCPVCSSLGPSVLSLGASWKPLRRLWWELLGLREPSGGLLRPIVALLTAVDKGVYSYIGSNYKNL